MISRVLLRRTLVMSALVAAVAACSDDDGDGPGVGSFTLGTPATASLTMTRGTATTVTIPITSTGTFEPVTLTADSVPAGVRVGFQPSTVTNAYEQVTVSITVNPDAAIGTGTIKIVARAENMTDQVARIAVTTTAQPTYTMTSASTTTPVVIQRGFSGDVTVNLARAGFTGPLTIAADPLPTGISVATVGNVTGNTATLTINASAAAATTTTGTLTLRATNPTIGDRTVSIRYNVLPEYTLTSPQSTAANAVVIQRTASGTATININRATYTGPVDLSVTGAPTGVTVPTVTGVTGNSATITINTANNAVADTGSFLVTGTVNGLQNQTVRVRYRINAEPGFQISAPATLASIQGNPDSLAVTVNREGGFTGAVTVTLSNLSTGVTAAPVTSASGSTVYVPLTIASTATAGTQTITVTVEGTGVATKTTTVSHKVQSRQLVHNVAVTRVGDTRARGSTRNYRIEVPAGTTQLRITFTGGTGDADVYLYNPSGAFVDGDEEVGNNEEVIIANPVAGNWFVQLAVWDPYENGTLTGFLTPAPAGSSSSSLLQAATQNSPVKFQPRRRPSATQPLDPSAGR